MTNDALISHGGAEDAIARALGLFMGRGRVHSVEDVATATGLSARTLYSYSASGEDRRTPSAENLLILMHFFGAPFTSKVLSAVGQGAHDLNPQPSDPAVIVATLLEDVTEFAIRAQDGVYCHVDEGALEARADRIIGTVTPFSSRKR